MRSSEGTSGSAHERRLDRVFHALSDRTRRAMLARLARGPARVGDLARPFAISRPAVSKHIKVLEGAGLMVRAVEGRSHHCSLEPAALADIEAWLAFYRGFWNGTLDALARHVRPRPGARR